MGDYFVQGSKPFAIIFLNEKRDRIGKIGNLKFWHSFVAVEIDPDFI